MSDNQSHRKVPTLCAKSANPYTYCPAAFRHQDDMVMEYISLLFIEFRRINDLPMRIEKSDEAKLIDRYTAQITAYYNGRISEVMNMARQELEQLQSRNAELENAIHWALGENGVFKTKKEGQGEYYWRTELRKRAGLKK